MSTRPLRRRGLAAAGVLAAGVLSGCHSPDQFLRAGVARGDLIGSGLAAPAAGRTPAANFLAATPGAGGMTVVAGEPPPPAVTSMTSTTQVAESTPLMMASGEVVSATANPGSPGVQAGATLPPMAMPVPAGGLPPMPVQAVTIQASGVSPAVQQPAIPGTPVPTTMALPATPMRGTGTPILMLIQGPNG